MAVQPGYVFRSPKPLLVEEVCAVTFRTADGGINLRDQLFEVESRMIDAAMRSAHGNKNRAAMLLGIERTTLVEKLRKRGKIQKKSCPNCSACQAV
jgi:DNA-binding NtrC family response regulator